MSESFELPEAHVPMDWTGERLTPGAGSQVRIEHFHRYFLARSLCRGLDVLDVAAGEGYGSALLAQTARSVVGVELDSAAVAHAQKAYIRSGLSFLEGDARRLPLPDHSVDMVVSFETIEHFGEHEEFLTEVKRVLRPGGRLIISSPERDTYLSASTEINPYHICELTGSEFVTLLQRHFAHISVQGQRTILGSAIVGDPSHPPSRQTPALTYERCGRETYDVSPGLPKPRYLLALASDRPIDEMPDSLYLESDAIQEAQEARDELRQALDAQKEGGLYARQLENELALGKAALAEAAAARDILAGKLADVQAQARAEARQAESKFHEIHDKLILTQEYAGNVVKECDALKVQINDLVNAKPLPPWQAVQKNLQRVRRNLKREARNAWQIVTFRRPLRFGRRAQQGVDEPAAPAGDAKAAFTASARTELLRFLASDERLVFPKTDSPDISVVIVLWNQAHLTLRCLRALLEQRGPSLEIILFDNDSRDETATLLGRIDGAKIVRNASNVGFLLGCNRGAEVAQGRALLLLNSDAFLRPGALAAALQTLESAEDVGAVGGRLILPDGRLQEAGSIIWSDASCLGYARGSESGAGEAMFRRDVDYCSGACLLTRRDLWIRLGGFDEAYAPAYYEETDYCLRLRKEGYRVVYEPTMAADHFEFGSEVKQGDGVGAQIRNRDLFLSRHREVLEKEHLTPGESHVLFARSPRVPKRPRLLVIDNEVPMQAAGSGFPRARSLLGAAQDCGWFVTHFPLHSLTVDWAAARAEIPWEVEIVTHRGGDGLAGFLQERAGFYDAILISRPENMAFVRGIVEGQPDLFQGARVIYDSEALATQRDILRAAREGRPFSEAEAVARIAAEIALARTADAIVCVNEAEAAAFRRLGRPVHTLSHSVDCVSDVPPWEERQGFLFIGRLLETNSPNWQGLSWFLRECWPQVRQALPQATLSVVGQLHHRQHELRAPGVRLLGSAADLTPFYNAARVFLAPVHFAAGVPAKVLESAAAGLPVVGTLLMARQVNWEPGVEMAAEDAADAFAAAAIGLHEDRVQWKALQTAAQARMRAEHSPTAFRESLRAILNPHGEGP
ncbi:MAG: methyltransferase domain-containing protein [Terrimicrobiaceae bacterium]